MILDPLSFLKQESEKQKKSMVDEMQNIEVEDINDDLDDIKQEDHIVAKLKASQLIPDLDGDDIMNQSEIVMVEDNVPFMYNHQRRATITNNESDDEEANQSENIETQ